MYWILFIGTLLISWIVSSGLKRRFQKYSRTPLDSGLSGAEVATKMLQQNGIYDVKVVSTPGSLSDHYNPATKTVNLSAEVYQGRNIASAAVAAHECGHAIQHAQAYSWLEFRSNMVPVVNFASRWVQWVIIGGLALLYFSQNPYLLLGGIGLFALLTLFSFVTLPVEIDASRRALAWLRVSGISSGQNHHMAQDALKWAAYTYVVAALGSLATLLYYISLFMGGDD